MNIKRVYVKNKKLMYSMSCLIQETKKLSKIALQKAHNRSFFVLWYYFFNINFISAFIQYDDIHHMKFVTVQDMCLFFFFLFPLLHLALVPFIYKICFHLFLLLFLNFLFPFPSFPFHLSTFFLFQIICYTFCSFFTHLVSHTRETMWYLNMHVWSLT